MTKYEALRLALEALELAHPRFGIATEKHKQAITAVEAALEAKDEPVGTAGELFRNTALKRLDLRPSTGIYITPPQRKPLSKAEAAITAYRGYDEYWTKDCNGSETEAWIACARAIEAAHGIKGEA